MRSLKAEFESGEEDHKKMGVATVVGPDEDLDMIEGDLDMIEGVLDMIEGDCDNLGRHQKIEEDIGDQDVGHSWA